MRGLKVFRLVSLECWEVYLRVVKVLRLQKHLIWVFWVFRGLYRRLECRKAYLKGLEVFTLYKHMTWVFCIFKDFYKSLSDERFVWKHTRCFELKEMLFVSWVWKNLCECIECDLKSRAFDLNDWRVKMTHSREFEFI